MSKEDRLSRLESAVFGETKPFGLNSAIVLKDKSSLIGRIEALEAAQSKPPELSFEISDKQLREYADTLRGNHNAYMGFMQFVKTWINQPAKPPETDKPSEFARLPTQPHERFSEILELYKGGYITKDKAVELSKNTVARVVPIEKVREFIAQLSSVVVPFLLQNKTSIKTNILIEHFNDFFREELGADKEGE